VKIFFDHITGKLTNYDLVYSLALAHFEEKEYCFAFENGWIPLSWYYTPLRQLTWINARNTRIQLNKFTFSKKQKKTLRKENITVRIYDKLDDALFTTISSIYKKYIKHKKFYEKNFEEESEVFERQDYLDWKYFIYCYKDKPIAFTELKVYDSALVEGNGAFGEVVSIDNIGVTVQGNGGRILIKRVRPASGNKISASEWATSAKINLGTKLGSNL